MRFCVVTVGLNCAEQVVPCLESIAQQKSHEVRVHVIDDASSDGTDKKITEFCEGRDGWTYALNATGVGAMKNQWDAWHAMNPGVDDCVVWCDLDDKLAHDNVFNVLAKHYKNGAMMTYGSYRPEPPSATCPATLPYPREIVRDGSYRAFILAGGGILHNHLRTVRGDLLMQITEDDCKDQNGNWWMAAPDMAVMIPAMEIAGKDCHVIKEVLYIYSSSLESAEWRLYPQLVNSVHSEILSRQPLTDVTPQKVRVAQMLVRRQRKTKRR